MTAAARARDRAGSGGVDRIGLALLLSGLGLLLVVAAAGDSVASPPLGPRGWAPPPLPVTLAPWTVVALQVTAYVLGGLSLVRQLRRPTPLRLRWWHLGLVAAAVLLTAPIGTADHTNYAAYGDILAGGGDPWAVSPQTWGGPVADLVQPPWRDTPSVYGPVGTWLLGLAGWLGEGNARQIVWVWQAIVVAAWLGVRALLVRLGAPAPTVDRWWTLNIVVVGAAVLGAHLDTVALAGLLAALALGLAGRPLLAGLASGVAASTKVTAGVVVLALLLGWWGEGGGAARERLRPWATRAGLLLVGAAVVAIPAHLLASPALLDGVRQSGSGVSYATPWRALYTVTDLALPEAAARSLAVWGSALWCLALAVLVWQLTAALRERPVIRALLALTAAYSLGAAYVLPWYELMAWAAVTLAVGLLAGSGRRGEVASLRPLLGLLLLRGVVLAIAYVPGRTVLPDDVATVTLGFRFVAAPLVTAAVWVALIVLVVRQRRRGRAAPAAG